MHSGKTSWYNWKGIKMGMELLDKSYENGYYKWGNNIIMVRTTSGIPEA